MKRGSFASRFGTIAAVGGSVIGLGNIWRFPYVAGENGGAAFILIYLTISFLISIPIMLSEFSLGRSTKRNSMRAFSKLAPGTKWKWVGYMGILCAFIILSFYCVIAGWSLEFLKESVLNRFHDRTPEQVAAAFDGFVASGWRPIAWTLVFIAASAFIVYSGIEKGIERYNKILMPMLFLLLFGMALNALTLDGARQGIDFLLKPDFSKITGTTVLEALGQSFFSMSLGMGCMITYGSYLRKNENMFRIGAMVSLSDITVAVLSGLAIFPAVFSFGISPTSGPELVFFDAAERFRPDERGLCDLGRIFRPAVLGRNHLVGLAARSHHRLPVGRNAHHAVESHRLHGLYRSRNRIAQRAVDDARFGPDYRRKKSVRSVRQPVVEPDDAAGRSVHRAVRRLGAIAPKAARRNDQRTEIRDPRLPGHPVPDPVRHPRSDRYPVRQPDRAAVLKEPVRQRMRRRNSAATTAVAIATFSDSDVGAAPG